VSAFKVIDGFLDDRLFDNVHSYFMNHVAWYYNPFVADSDDTDAFYFSHTMYMDYKVNSVACEAVQPIVDKLQPKAIIRIKANLYTNDGQYREHGWHTDFPYSHTAAILYVNTNNGFTILEDGTKIKSIANRLLVMDGSKPHRSTTCTDQNVRVNIGLNYFSGEDDE
jgi:hypothetical protein